MTLSEVAAVVGGEVVDGDEDTVVSGPATLDSRDVEPGGLFAAFVGENVDGHAFAEAATDNGAAAVLGSRPTGRPTVVVPDVQAALASLAHHVLGRLPQVTVLAVTGSQGKTSTKDLLAGVLADRAETVATRGSFNNELGLPLTVLRATPSTRFLLLEMGARGVGHIAELCAVARPDVALVLNVGKAHLGEFGTQDDIARAKGELVEALPATGTAVLNADDHRVLAMRERTAARVVTFGLDDPASDARPDAATDVAATDVALDEQGRPAFRLHHGDGSAPVQLQLVGEHHVANAAAAAAAALAVGVALPDVAASLGRVAALSRWRMEVTRRDDGVTVVNDAYNANPDSMAAALRALTSLGAGGGRRIAVVGEMKELGASTAAEHAEVGRLARSLGVDVVVAVGDVARDVLTAHGDDEGTEDAGEHGTGRGGEDDMGTTQAGGTAGTLEIPAADNAAATRWLHANLAPGDVVLVKASRGARLDEVADALLPGPAHEGQQGEVSA